MKYSVAAVTLLAGLGCTQGVRRQDTRLFSVPSQPTPNESTPTAVFTILPVSTGSASGPGSSGASQPSETIAPTTMGHITPDPTTSGVTPTITSSVRVTAPGSSAPGSSAPGSSASGSSAPGSSAPGSSASGSATQSGTRSGSSTGTPSTTSNPAAAPTAFGSNLVAGVIALAGLAVAI
ncbi:hypothetical protein J3458_017266 [Metarhizium acridum]|uniref:Uncharacterized protein n=1 Tax=Metarhizium acridum (strain CQMa 102) TaxID=655827 RepID=E9EB90_METAQ|nr:uncharacterized protein MAC_07138 [Metarhizium acridum CQMa 102]EFY86823.1 hypothetical protein MAC_07138 [Metarhizium acridum CQMa 102]KAG8410510.1 hypothetical protein J3458_017266 [Metarhizium acridum]